MSDVTNSIPAAGPSVHANPIAADDRASPEITEIQPSHGRITPNLKELWRYRELLFFLTWRDIKVRYKQTALGVTWAIIQPLFAMLVFSLFFGRLANMPSDGIEYPLWSYAGLVPWTFFSTGLTQSSNSLVEGSNLVRKVYFPRLAAPTASVLAVLVDMCISFLVLLLLMAFYGYAPMARLIFMPLFVLLGFVTALGAGLWLSALNVKYRDVRYVLPFLIQLWMFASPVTYSSTLLPEKWRLLYGLNPMVGVVEGFRWSVLGVETAPGPMVLVSAVVSLTVLTGGAYYFARMEKHFADIV